MRSRSRLTIGSILRASMMPPGILGVVISSMSCARSSSVRTPSAMHMRFIDPNRLTATGTSKPAGRSKRRPGPPPGDFDARSVTAAISRSGLTGSAIRESSRSLSRAAMKSLRSLNTYTLHLFCNPRRQLERAATGGAVDDGRAAVADGSDKVGKLATKRLVSLDGNRAAFDRRPRTSRFTSRHPSTS